MSYWAAGLVVLVAAAMAGASSYLISKSIGAERQRQRQAFGAPVFQQVGIMFSVLLSFVFSEVWSEYNIAAQAISHECGALHGAAMLASALPRDTGRGVNEAILSYATTVVAVEWPLMAKRRRSAEAAEAFRVALDRAARLAPAQPADLTIRSQLLGQLIEAHGFRETRTFQITAGLPLMIWIVLIGMALVLDGFLLLAGTEIRSHVFLAAAAAGSTAAALVMVRMLDFPFEGALALPEGDFYKLVGEVGRLTA